MNVLEVIQQKIDATEERIAACERDLTNAPGLWSIGANLESLKKMKARLLREYEEAEAELKNGELKNA